MYFVDADAVAILEVFNKRTRATPRQVVAMCMDRLQAYKNARKGRGRAMDEKTRKKLATAGWSTGDATDFLELSEAETEFIETKLALAAALRTRRLDRHLNQTQVARIVGSSQSRVAKMEAADPSVSLDLMAKTLLKLGAARGDLAQALMHEPAIAG